MIRYRPFVMRLRRDGTIIRDQDGWMIMLFNDNLWFAHFGPEWIEKYETTWAFGIGRDHIWWFTPALKGTKHDNGSD